MNKLFTKIVGATLGLTMAIGVGVAIASNSKEASSVYAASAWQAHTGAITAGNEYLIVSVSGTYCMVPANTSSTGTTTKAAGGYSATSFNAASGPDMGFVFEDAGSGNFYIKDGACFVRANGTTNNGLASATSNSTNPSYGTWIVTETSTSGEYTLINTNGTGRQISLYGTTNWRSYGTTSGSKTNVKLYEKAKTTQTITVDPASKEAYTDETFSLTTNATSANWALSNNTCGATLSAASGKSVSVSATGAGSVRVTASASGYTSPYVDLTFIEKPTSPFITPEKASTSGYTGLNEILSFTYGNLTSTLGVSSSDLSVVTVETPSYDDGEGTVQINFVGAGSTTVKFKDGSNELASVSVSVTASSVTISGLAATGNAYIGKTLDLGSTITVTAVGSYSNAVTWESDDDSIATVNSSGVVTGVAEGTVDITVTSDDLPSVTATCSVTVSEAPLEYEIVFGTTEGTGGITDFSNTSYIIPAEVTLDNVQGNLYSNTSNQAASIRFGKSGTTGSFDASITGNYYIVSVKCNLKYYGSDTTATFSVTPNGGEAISKTLTSDWQDYTYDVSDAKVKKVTLGTDINGKRAYLSGFTITYASQKVLSNIALSGTYPTSFTKGDTFSHSGMVVTANYSDSTSSIVTGSASWSSPDMSTSGQKTVTVSYSDEYGSASKDYTITVEYANPTGIVLSQNTKKLALLEEFDVSSVDVTINPSTSADQSLYEWVVQDSDGLVEGDTYEFTDGVFYAMEPADAVVLRCRSTKAGFESTVYADVNVEITGDPIVTLFNSSDVDKTNGSESVYSDAGDITYHVTTENFSGTITYTWSSSNDSIISVDSDNGTSCDFFVEGSAGSARLSCRVQDTASHDVTVYIDVTVVAWSVTSVTWTAPTINVYSGASLSSTAGWNVRYSTNSGKTDQPADSFNVKLAGSTISLPYEWKANDDGKALGVEVGGVLSSTTTVAVTQSLRPIMASVPGESATSTLTFEAACGGSGTADDEKAWTVTSDGTESTYDSTKGIHYGTGSAAVQYIKLTSSAFNVGNITKVVVNASTASSVSATVGVKVGGVQFGGEPQSLSSSAANYTFDGNVSANTIEVEVTKPSSATKAIYCKSIAVTYATPSGEEVDIANIAGHESAQRAVVNFAKAFNTALSATDNCSTGLTTAWSDAQTAWNTFLSDAAALGETEEVYAKNMIKYAYARWTEDTDTNYEYCLERALATYERCVSAHDQTAFMSSVRPVQSAMRINPLANVVTDSNTIMIVVVVSMISLTAIGGYFYLRKRKEN